MALVRLRLQTESFQVYYDDHVCVSRDEMQLEEKIYTWGTYDTRLGDLWGGGRGHHPSLSMREGDDLGE